MKYGYAYIITNSWHSSLYVGVTSNIVQRIQQHKFGFYKTAFSKKYKLNKLVWVQEIRDINDAIQIEKKIKGRTRQKKIALINRDNPSWDDLSGKR